MRRTKVYVDALGSQRFEAYIRDEERWNGFVCPYFEKEEADRLIEALKEIGHKAFYWKEDDAYVVSIDNQKNDLEKFRAIDVEGRHLYPIGAYYWTWGEV